MIQNFVFSVFDKVSDTFVATFLCNNVKVAKKSFKKFVENNKLDWDDVALYQVCNVAVPLTADDLQALILIEDDSFGPQLILYPDEENEK